MVEIVLLAALFFALGWAVKHPLAVITFPVIGGFIGFLIAWGIGASIDVGPRVLTKTTVVQDIHLASLKHNDVIEGGGSFFLGIGSVSVGQLPYYYFYKVVDDHTFQLDRLPADDNVYISEEERTDGEIVKLLVQDQKEERCGKIGVFRTYYIPAPSDAKGCDFGLEAEVPYGDKTRYEIHVPKGSILHDYTLQ